MSSVMVAVGKDNYQEEVVTALPPVVVDFWGPRCAPCLALLPEVEELAKTYQDRVKFCKVNTAENRRLCVELKVMALPTFLFYRQGEEVARLSGAEATKEKIMRQVEELVG